MPLVTPFDASFWSTEETNQTQTPEQKTAAQNAKQNLALNGSATVENRWDEYGQKEYFSSITNNYYPSAEAARADESLFNQLGAGGWAAQKTLNASMSAATGPQTSAPTNPNQGQTDALVNGIANDFALPQPPNRSAMPSTAQTPTVTVTPRAGFTNEVAPVRKGTVQDDGQFVPSAYTGAAMPTTVPNFPAAVGGAPAPPPPEPGAQAPDLHRDKVDAILGGLSGYEQSILNLAEDNTGGSVAEAQLMKADALAKIRARDELAANQAGALGAARSARNRGDRALLERQAVGEQAYLGSQGQREDTLRQAELEGNLSILRATENEHDRQFKLDALTEAGKLGLNRAALEVDIGKADLDSANNWVNNEARTALQNGALDEQQYEALLNYSTQHTAQLLQFTQAMAGIQYEYDKLGVDDQNVADGLLMQKYGIDQQTMVAIKQIKQAGKFKWDEFLGKLIPGAIAAGATGGASLAVAGAAAAGGAAADTVHSY